MIVLVASSSAEAYERALFGRSFGGGGGLEHVIARKSELDVTPMAASWDGDFVSRAVAFVPGSASNLIHQRPMRPRENLLKWRRPLTMGTRRYQIQKNRTAQAMYTVWMTMKPMGGWCAVDCGRGDFFASSRHFVREIGTRRPRKKKARPKRRGDTMLRRVGIRAAAALVATTATAAATTAVAEPASPSPLRAKTPADSPFSYRELDEAVARRQDQERALATYINTVAPMIDSARGEMARAQKLGDAAALERARARFATLAARAQAETAALTWGSPDGQQRRAEFVERFGCVGWTDAALAEIAKHSPIVEMGAGKGQWQRALTERGADVLAYDDRSAVPGTNEPEPTTFFSRTKAPGRRRRGEAFSSRDFFGVVRRGDERKLRSFWVRRADRTLLVVYPEGDLLVKCPQNYDGAVVLFVGEGRGGVNGSADVFDYVEKRFDVEKSLPVRPFGDGHEKLWVLRRKPTINNRREEEG